MTEDPQYVAVIRAKNDAFRKAGVAIPSTVGRKVHTARIAGLEPDVVADIWERVAAFDAFTPENDPHGEHDFGAFDYPGVGKIFWKIDYYDESYGFAAENPASPSARRVLTVMLADEY